MSTKILATIPVLPVSDLKRDVAWYETKMGLKTYYSDDKYAVLYRDNLCLHLQWHADTLDDPLLGGAVVRILVDDIKDLLEEFVRRGTITPDKFRSNTPWKTNEFGFYDLNRNAIFILEDLT
jgi:catechol 2,3-dioxygenase-like lactoylglutathione lyase family enzyme